MPGLQRGRDDDGWVRAELTSSTTASIASATSIATPSPTITTAALATTTTIAATATPGGPLWSGHW